MKRLLIVLPLILMLLWISRSCDPSAGDRILEATRVKGNGYDVAWFVRPTGATDPVLYLLETKGSAETEWEYSGIFSRFGEEDPPRIRVNGNVIIVSCRQADVAQFSNNTWVRQGNEYQYLRIIFVETRFRKELQNSLSEQD